VIGYVALAVASPHARRSGTTTRSLRSLADRVRQVASLRSLPGRVPEPFKSRKSASCSLARVFCTRSGSERSDATRRTRLRAREAKPASRVVPDRASGAKEASAPYPITERAQRATRRTRSRAREAKPASPCRARSRERGEGGERTVPDQGASAAMRPAVPDRASAASGPYPIRRAKRATRTRSLSPRKTPSPLHRRVGSGLRSALPPAPGGRRSTRPSDRKSPRPLPDRG